MWTAHYRLQTKQCFVKMSIHYVSHTLSSTLSGHVVIKNAKTGGRAKYVIIWCIRWASVNALLAKLNGSRSIAYDFYRAMLCIRGTSHGPVSVCPCLSGTSRCSTKKAKRRITQTTPHDTPGTLVFWCQRSPRNSTGVTPYGGAKCRWGGSKSATFDQ